jgi:hypothetical protein
MKSGPRTGGYSSRLRFGSFGAVFFFSSNPECGGRIFSHPSSAGSMKETFMAKRFTATLAAALRVLAIASMVASPLFATDDSSIPILTKLKHISTLSSTVPANGDVNPYGLVRVPHSKGKLQEGHYLISNFNASSNLQGTGTTIVDVSPRGTLTVFAQINAATLPGPCPGGVGLTTALAVLRSGWVIVGSLPTTDGSSATAQAGCLIVLDNSGNAVETIYGSMINGPWDMTAIDGDHQAALFVTNVLNGTVAANGAVVNQGTVVRVNLAVSENQIPFLESLTVVGAGFSERTDPAALVIGPTGVALSPSCRYLGDSACWTPFGEDEPVLYVADSVNNRIAVITDPLTRTIPSIDGNTLSSGGSLNDPLGLTVAPNGHIITVNGNDGIATEITPRGAQIATRLLDNTGGPPPGAGTLFGVFFDPAFGLVFVDDGSNTLNVLQ